MFNKLSMRNFRKHTDRTVDFTGGLNGITGPNEGSKSTILEAIGYALFGTKALRSSLDDAVTYGEAVNTLKVTLDFTVEGTEYTITRGKPGAELTYTGGAVTGQTEVSNYVAKLLGFDLGGAGSLALAGQNSIRGALEEGPKAATELIERLADFQQIDDLIELLQAKLTLGSAAVLESRLATAQARADELAAVEVPDTDSLVVQSMELTGKITNARAQKDAAEAAHVEAKGKSDVAAVLAREFASRTADLEHAKLAVAGQKLTVSGALDAVQDSTPDYDVEARIAELEQAKTVQANSSATAKLYGQVLPLLSYGGDVFEGTEAELQAYIRMAQAKASTAGTSRLQATGRIAVLEASIQAGSCTLCGKDVSEVPEVLAKNAKLLAEIEELRQLATRLGNQKAEIDEDRLAHMTVLDLAKPYLAVAARGHDKVKVCTDQVPPRLVWVGPAPSEVQDTADYDALIKAERKGQRDLTVLEASLRSAKDALALRLDQLTAAEKALVGAQSVDPAQALATTQAAAEEASAARLAVRALEDELRAVSQDLARAESQWQQTQTSLAQAKEQVTALTEDLRVLAFNNALLKRVREVRPVLADKVWSLVLGSISKFFSEMRGEGSVVTKGADGFMVDGHTVKSLSGSTLDILGLAIRCSLLRMFLPMSSFLVLDEPGAAMDQERMQAMLSFLSGLGFSQVILVTHEETSVALADNLITV